MLKRVFALFALFLLLLLVSPAETKAARQDYYDFGPYYNQTKVLGISFSALENLPAPAIPKNLMPEQATGVIPGSPFYFLEQAAENVQLAFTFNPEAREELRLNFAKERLSEAKTLLDQGKTEAASQAMDDYKNNMSTAALNLSSLIKSNDPAAQNLTDKIEEAASAHAIVAQNLSLSSSPVQAEIWAMAEKASKETLDHVADAQKVPAIPEGLSSSVQNLRQQGVLSEEESNKLYSLESRGELRDELDKLASSGMFPIAELAKLDESIARRYPDIHKQQTANLEVLELRTYQSLPQPSQETLEKLAGWQKDPSTPPSNEIRPYLWYNRAQDLAKETDLSNYSPDQQAEIAHFYPTISDNPTYSPPPSPSPSPFPSPSPAPQEEEPSESAEVSSAPSPSPEPSPSTTPQTPYFAQTEGPLPGTTGYFFNQLGEQLSFAFTLDPVARANQKMAQAERRLAEAKALAGDPAKESLYVSTIKQYQQAMTDASTYLKETKDNPSARETAERLETQAARHGIALEKGYLPTPSTYTQLVGDTIQIVETTMDRSADTLDRPALPPVLAQRLDSLKAQGLILSEEAEKLVNSNSREEVREKIRDLVEIGTFPLADAKKMDEAQKLTSPTEYNQLVEVRKVDELQRLRAAQAEFAQTSKLKATASSLSQREAALVSSIEPSLLTPEDLAGRDDLIQVYETLVATASARPINSGQFGPDVKPGATPAQVTPTRQDAVLTACPVGTIFKQFEGCVWADTGKSLNDYDQYKCDGPRQYFSFAARKCVPYEPGTGFGGDSQPICPVGYTWAWQTQSCQRATGGIILPAPKPEPEPINKEEEKERSKSCPEGATYKAPSGCVWDKDDKPVYDSRQYRCARGEYYSFEQYKCVPAPEEGKEYPGDAAPSCKEEGSYWSWSNGKCMSYATPDVSQDSQRTVDDPKPYFVTPGSPFYFIKQFGETIQKTTAFTPEARGQVSLSQAEDRLAEAMHALKNDDGEGVKTALASYTATMQNLVGDLSKAQLSEMAKNQIGKKLAEEAADQNLLLQKLATWATAEQDTAINAAVSATILSVDKAADISGETAIPDDIRTKIETLPENVISEENKKELLAIDSRVEARLKLGGLATTGVLTQTDTAFLNKDFTNVDQNAKTKVEELKRLEEVAKITEQKTEVEEKVQKNEAIVEKLTEFQNTFQPGQDIPAEIRPYVRLTRIDEIGQTIRPDVVKVEDFQNRKDVVLAVVTLQEEFRPTKESVKQVSDFRRRNPDKPLPLGLARIEALSFSLGTREQSGPCFLPPPFPANTPCPAPGSTIPVASYFGGKWWSDAESAAIKQATDKDGKPLVYGQGPQPESIGICPKGYHWMYDSGGWCMADGSNYSSTPSTPTSTYSYTIGDVNTNDGCPYGYDSDGKGNCIRNSYPALYPPSYYGGPTTTSYPTGTTTSETPPAEGYNCGSQPYDPVTKKCKDGACPEGFNWDGSKCVALGGSYYSPNLDQSSCGPGYYWDGKGCIPLYVNSGPTLYSPPRDSPYGPYSPNLTSSCGPGYYWDGRGCIPTTPRDSAYSCNPSAANSCGPGYYWDSGSCSCRGASSYSGGGGPTPGNYCQGVSCSEGTYLDYSSCSCRSSGSSSSYSSGWSPSSGSCTQQNCGSDQWFDWGTCSCRPSGNTYTPSSQPTPSEPAPAPAAPPPSEPAPPPSEPAPAPAAPPPSEPAPPPSEPAPAPVQGASTERGLLELILNMLFGR